MRVALDSFIAGKWGLIKSSMVTVAKELKAEDIVLKIHNEHNVHSISQNSLVRRERGRERGEVMNHLQ